VIARWDCYAHCTNIVQYALQSQRAITAYQFFKFALIVNRLLCWLCSHSLVTCLNDLQKKLFFILVIGDEIVDSAMSLTTRSWWSQNVKMIEQHRSSGTWEISEASIICGNDLNRFLVFPCKTLTFNWNIRYSRYNLRLLSCWTSVRASARPTVSSDRYHKGFTITFLVAKHPVSCCKAYLTIYTFVFAEDSRDDKIITRCLSCQRWLCSLFKLLWFLFLCEVEYVLMIMKWRDFGTINKFCHLLCMVNRSWISPVNRCWWTTKYNHYELNEFLVVIQNVWLPSSHFSEKAEEWFAKISVSAFFYWK